MRLLTAEQSRQLDQRAEEEAPGRLERLMETAGEQVFGYVTSLIEKGVLTSAKKSRIAILCGPGNNGGDGLVISRLLKVAGFSNLQVFAPLGGETSQLFQLNLERVRSKDVVVESLGKWNKFQGELDLIIDALFGTGLSRPLGGIYLESVRKANSIAALRIAVDVPSGLDSDRGNVLGEGFLADHTVTFTSAKPGFFVNEGPSYVGKLCVREIGFSCDWVKDSGDTHFLVTRKFVQKNYPSRDHHSNKSKHGKLLVVAGHKGMWGAGILTTRAGYRAGSGYVTLASFEDPSIVLKEIPEVLSCHLTASTQLPPRTAVVVGPGLGVGDLSYRLIEKFRMNKEPNVVLDADALSVLAQYSFGKLPASWMLTPHAGELSRIIDMTSDQIEEDRFAAVEMAVKKWGCSVLLKGYHTVIGVYSQDKIKKLVVPTGNEALAKAGTGDVLSGIIGGLVAQGVPAWKAAAMGAYLHGLCADVWVKRKSKQSLTASDLLHMLPELMKKVLD